jgi:glycine cleavage system regulatory protein
LSINQIASNKHSWSIYPNPTQNILTVLFNSTLNTTQKIEIYNMQGQLVQQSNANKGLSKYSISLQVPSGIYIVKINNESKRLVVE